MNNPLKETDNYFLTVGKKEDTYIYQIINKKHNVIEIETFLLPQAIKQIYELEAALNAQLDIYEDEANDGSFDG